MDDLAGKEGVPPTMLNGQEYAQLVAARLQNPDDDVVTSDACRALIDVFVALVNASPYRELEEPTYDRESIMADPGDRPHIQCRLAHSFYRFDRVADGPRQNVPNHGYCRTASSHGDEYYCSETTWRLAEVGQQADAEVTQVTFVARGPAERDAMYKPLSLAATFLTEDTETPLSIVRAGRRSMEMSTVAGVDFCPTKTTATEVLSLHLHELLPAESWTRLDGQKIEQEKAPLVVLDMDGTVTRKDALHGNTVSNNLAKSAAVAAIKQCLRQGVVAVNSGNHALLQLWRLIAAFGAAPDDMNLLRRLVLVAQGGTVAYTFDCSDTCVMANRLHSWDVWNRSLPEDREIKEPVVVPLYVDDELGGNESTFSGQLPVSVAGMFLEAGGRAVAHAPKGQDEGLALALESFLYLNSLADNNKFKQVNTMKLEMMLRDKEARRQAEEAAEEAALKLSRRMTMIGIGSMRSAQRPALARQATARQLPVRLIPITPGLARMASSNSNTPLRLREKGTDNPQ